MNDNEFDLTARAWLEDGPTRMADHALRSALEEVHATRQRRAVWPAWRASPVNLFASVAVAAVLVVAAGIVAGNVVRRLPDGSTVGGPTTPAGTADITPGLLSSPSLPRALGFPSLPMSTFVSPTYGFSFQYPDRGALAPAKVRWDPTTEPPFEPGGVFSGAHADGFDVVETGFGAVFEGASTEIPEGVPIDDWIDASLASRASTPTCMVPRGRQSAITIDGHSGRISEGCARQLVATVVVDRRLFVFMLLHGRDEGDARAIFDAFVDTIRLPQGE
jgi:hypothetical protein